MTGLDGDMMIPIISDGTIDRVDAHGYYYNSRNVSIALDSPVSDMDDVLNDEQHTFFTQTMSNPERLSTGIPPAENMYKGSWFWQGFEPTCLPWAVANAMHAHGVRPNPILIAEMLNYAIDEGKSKEEGMFYYEAIDILERYPGNQVEIVEIPYEERLSIVMETQPVEIFSKYQLYFNNSSTPDEIARDAKEINTNVFIKNAALVRKTVDSGDVLLTSVRTTKYTKADKGGSHAICIVGYRVSEQGNMDVQVLDAAKGKIWMSLEHLSSAVNLTTYKMVKKTS